MACHGFSTETAPNEKDVLYLQANRLVAYLAIEVESPGVGYIDYEHRVPEFSVSGTEMTAR